MLVRITNRENPDQTAEKQSDLGLRCLSRPFWQATSVQNFRTFTKHSESINRHLLSNFVALHVIHIL